MSEGLKIAFITGLIAVVGEVVIAIINSKVMMKELEKQSALADARLEKSQAVTDTKLENLTNEVRAHNNFAQKVPVLEEQLKAANHRIADLEAATNRLASSHDGYSHNA